MAGKNERTRAAGLSNYLYGIELSNNITEGLNKINWKCTRVSSPVKNIDCVQKV